MNILIRRAKPIELEEILLLSDELAVSDLPFDKKIDINWAHTDNGKKYYEDRINGISGVCFVAEIDNQIIGFASGEKKEAPPYRLVKIAELENIFVKKEHRSKGIGKKLMEAFLNWAKELGVDKVTANAFALNDEAVAFYKREGFLPQDLILEKYL